MKRALIIAAHPDDEILGCGATISKYKAKGVDFSVLFIGEGSSCRFINLAEELVGKAKEMRKKSAHQALNLLGIQDFEFHDLPCGRFDQVPIIEINKLIEAAITRFSPDTVFTHSSVDANNDHQIVFRSTLMATRPGAQNAVATVLSYEVLSSTEWSYGTPFTPNIIEEISDERKEGGFLT
jgi:LmbE family N-acetylglucosaminyl deacetylase